MKRFFSFNYKLLILIYRAWQSLKDWFDPAMEGNPYERNFKSYKANKSAWLDFKSRYILQES